MGDGDRRRVRRARRPAPLRLAGPLPARRVDPRLSQAAPGLLGEVPLPAPAGRRWWWPRPGAGSAWPICADMIYRRVWDDYRGRVDLAVIAAAWPEFAYRDQTAGGTGCSVGSGRCRPRSRPRSRGTWACRSSSPTSAAPPGPRSRCSAWPGRADRRPVRRPEQHLRRARRSAGPRRGRAATRPLRSHHPRSPRATLMPFYVPVGPRGLLFRFGMI